MGEPKFGDWIRGNFASERNPQRDGMYIRKACCVYSANTRHRTSTLCRNRISGYARAFRILRAVSYAFAPQPNDSGSDVNNGDK